MIRAAIIVRSTLFTVRGGDTIQVVNTAHHLRELGIEAEIITCGEELDDDQYDILHFFNLIRPADILRYAMRTRLPYVVSPVWIDYAEYDQVYRAGTSGAILKAMPRHTVEYAKTIGRWLAGRDRLHSKQFLWKGQRGSIEAILRGASMLLPNSHSEFNRLSAAFLHNVPYLKVNNGADDKLFSDEGKEARDPDMVVCAARIEGIKNQLNLVRALNGTKFKLYLIGSPTPNQPGYYRACRKLAGKNVFFTGPLSQRELSCYYQRAAVHALPSWFETTGLSSLEAAAMGCRPVISRKGDTEEYFGDAAWYCDPGNPDSIRDAVERAAASPCNEDFRQRIKEEFNWRKAAGQTSDAYRKVLSV